MRKKQILLLATSGIVLGVGILCLPKNEIQQAKLSASPSTQLTNSNSEISNNIKQDLAKIEEGIEVSILNREDIAAIKQEIIQAENNKQFETAAAKLAEYQRLIAKQHVSTIESATTSSQQTTQQETTTSHTETTAQVKHRVIDVPTIDAYRIIVNKKHALSPDYYPGENPVAKRAFLKLKSDMQNLGFAVSDNYSGFRSYQYQQQVYGNYVRQDGQVNADKYSARPGHSEHQTGLAFDFIDTTGQLLGEGIHDGATEWLATNAHRYGFVVRYQSGKEHITGYMAETWHVRFIGNEATAVYQSGLTLEEYYGVSGGDYE